MKVESNSYNYIRVSFLKGLPRLEFSKFVQELLKKVNWDRLGAVLLLIGTLDFVYSASLRIEVASILFRLEIVKVIFWQLLYVNQGLYKVFAELAVKSFITFGQILAISTMVQPLRLVDRIQTHPDRSLFKRWFKRNLWLDFFLP